MPLEQRVVEPITISRGTLPLDSHGNLAISIPNELECVTNGSLANVIRQLSSLSRFAEDLFGGIIQETSVLVTRASSLQGRIDRLAVKVTQLDSSVEEISLHDIHLKKPFKSSSSYDQQVVSRGTIPPSILEQYNTCDKPPPLSNLNPYRDDGRDGLKFYTDPKYFFELWKQEMLQMTEREKRNRTSHGQSRGQLVPKSSVNGQITTNGTGTAGRRQQKPRPAVNTTIQYRQKAQEHGEFLNPIPTTNGDYGHHSHPHPDANGYQVNHPHAQRPNSLEVNQYEGYNQYQPSQGYPNGQLPNQQHNVHHPQQQMQTSNNMQKISSPSQNNHHQGMEMPGYGQYTPQDNNMGHYQSHPGQSTPQSAGGTPTRRGSTQNRPSQPPPAPPSNPASSNSSGQPTPQGTPSRSRSVTKDRESLGLPPPPPPPPPPFETGGGGMNGDLPLPPPHSAHSGINQHSTNNQNAPHIPSHAASSSAAPPPPPPPPPMNDSTDSSRSGPPSFAHQIQMRQQQLQPPKLSTASKVLPQHVAQQDARSGLLAAIREGIKLRRVEDNRQKENEKTAPCNDVASILARRIAIENSDTDSHSDGSGEEDEEWDEEG